MFWGKIHHILRENYEKLSHLHVTFMEVTSTKQDFEKNNFLA